MWPSTSIVHINYIYICKSITVCSTCALFFSCLLIASGLSTWSSFAFGSWYNPTHCSIPPEHNKGSSLCERFPWLLWDPANMSGYNNHLMYTCIHEDLVWINTVFPTLWGVSFHLYNIPNNHIWLRELTVYIWTCTTYIHCMKYCESQ